MTDPTPATPEPVDASAPDALTVPAMPAQRTDSEGANDPWSREAETVGVPASDLTDAPLDPASTLEVSAAPSDPHDGAMTEIAPAAAEGTPKRRRRRTPIVISASAVLVLLLGVGAYAGVRAWTGAGIKEAESAVPASVSAFARIDIKPGYRDQLAFDNLVKKFPTGKSTQDFLTTEETNVSKSAGLNFNADVKPWFAGQVGAAEWTNAAGKPVSLLVFSSKDDAAAKTALGKVQAKEGKDFGFVLSNGFAIIAGSDTAQPDAVAAAAAAKAHNLADSPTYKSAISHLAGHNLVIAYVDLASLGKVAGTQMPGSDLLGSDSDPLPGSDASCPAVLPTIDPSSTTDPFGGIDPMCFINSPTGGLGGTDSIGGSSSMMPGLLASSALSGAFATLKGTIVIGGSVVDDGVEIRAHIDGLSADATRTAGVDVAKTLQAMPDTTVVGVALDGLDPKSSAATSLAQSLSGLSGMLTGGSIGFASPDGPTGNGAAIAQILQNLAGPIQSIMTSKVISLALTGMTGGIPTGYVSVDFGSAADASSTMTAIQSVMNAGQIPGVSIDQNGAQIKATIGGPASSGKLSSVGLFTEATKGMSNDSMMAYVNVQKLVAAMNAKGSGMTAQQKAQIAPIKAIAVSTTSAGTSSDELVRVIIK